MKKYLIRLAAAAVLLIAVGCGALMLRNEHEVESGMAEEETDFQARVVEINEDSALVEALESDDVRKDSLPRYSFGTAGLEDIGAEPGDLVNITYTGGVMETYPFQINTVSWSMVKKISGQGRTQTTDAEEAAIPVRESECAEIVFEISKQAGPGGGTFEMSYADDSHDKVWYYDEFFSLERYEDGSWEKLPMQGGLCGTTSYMEIPEGFPEELELNWSYLYGPLEPGIYSVTKEVFPEKAVEALDERMDQSMPEPGPDTDAGIPVYVVFELKEGLGLHLKVQNASSAGLTLQFLRDGGRPSGDLQYGSRYWLQRLEDGRWCAVEHADPDQEIAWTEEAYNIPEEGSEQTIDWTWLYGELPSGKYRICKDVMDFRETGDYDLYLYLADFKIP